MAACQNRVEVDMANAEHLGILKQGVGAWNAWKQENPDVRPDLSGADLHAADLRQAQLGGADLRAASLTGAPLVRADLRFAEAGGVDLPAADLRHADLRAIEIAGADLSGADLRSAWLLWVDVRRVKLRGARFGGVHVAWGTLAGVDLSEVRGLGTVLHHGPSTIGIDTIYPSKGRIPKAYLRGTGVPEGLIRQIRSLVDEELKGYPPYFISYCSTDAEFVKRFHADLQSSGVRCWVAPEDMRIAARIQPAIDEAIRGHDKLCLVLSEALVASEWVEQEVESALARERREGREVLFPIRLDDAVTEAEVGWAAHLRNTRHIEDFRKWENPDEYQKAFRRLLGDLKAGEGGA